MEESKVGGSNNGSPGSGQSTKSSLSVPTPGGLFPLPASQQVASTGSATGNPRNKVGLKKGFSLMDWVRLTKSGKDLTGVGGPRVKGKLREITRAELKKHRTRKDAWMAINGAVFNVTPYMDYHPGGWDELARGAGIDATDLFNEVHRWVNYESLLQACLVGKLVDGGGPIAAASKPANSLLPPPSAAAGGSLLPPPTGAGGLLPPLGTLRQPGSNTGSNDEVDGTTVKINTAPPQITTLPPIVTPEQAKPPVFSVPKVAVVAPSAPNAPVKPTHDFFQSDSKVTLNIYCKRKSLTLENFIVDNFLTSIRVVCYFPSDGSGYTFHYELAQPIGEQYSMRLSGQGKLELGLVKQSATRWQGLGSAADNHDWFGPIKNMKVNFHKFKIASRERVTHDTSHFVLKSFNQSHMKIPPGQHVHIRDNIEGIEITRSYTPVQIITGEKRQEAVIDFLIKIYPDGALTPKLDLLQPGDDLEISDYTGDFTLDKLQAKSTIYLLAAGTGITPMLSILPEIGENTKICLLNFNKTTQDVIWGEELERFAQSHNNFKSYNIFSNEDGASELTGRIRLDLLERFILDKGDDILACVCGPKGFVQTAERILLDDLKLKPHQLHLFQG